jgi:(p)ppGpp synthase/HD superfamily hydrolase
MSTEAFSTELYKKHLEVALRAHGAQQTPTGLPYAYHFTSVAVEVINAVQCDPIGREEADVAIGCALLHDVLEDTDYDLPSWVNPLIRDGVGALTKDASLSTKREKMRDSLERLRHQPRCVQMVKMADRITNLDPPPQHWDAKKRGAYREEAQTILDALADSSQYLASKLKKRIARYGQYINP